MHLHLANTHLKNPDPSFPHGSTAVRQPLHRSSSLALLAPLKGPDRHIAACHGAQTPPEEASSCLVIGEWTWHPRIASQSRILLSDERQTKPHHLEQCCQPPCLRGKQLEKATWVCGNEGQDLPLSWLQSAGKSQFTSHSRGDPLKVMLSSPF